jgi:FHS family L-fucose permease-like MFS transporter
MSDRDAPLTERRYLLPFVLVTSLFFLWAIGVNLNDVLIPHLKKALELSDFQSSLIQTAFFGGYFLMALPAGWLMRRFGYRSGILIGIALCGVGTLLFQPAATARWYPFFLLALFVMACGQCVLEVAANPYVTLLGPAASAARRLTTAQIFNALGSVVTPILGARFILSSNQAPTNDAAALDAWRVTEASSVKMPYLVITAIFVLVGLVMARAKLPEVKESGVGGGRGLGDAWKHAHLRRGVFAQFCYVGAQVGAASFVIRFAKHAVPGTDDIGAAYFLFWHQAGFLVGRIVGSALMKRIPAPKMLAAVAVLGLAAAGIAATGSGVAAVWMVVLLGLFHSIQFPTIFALSLDGLGEDTKLGSSLLVMSIVGGAIIPAVMGRLSDATSIQTAFLIPAACYLVVLHFALRGHRHTAELAS